MVGGTAADPAVWHAAISAFLILIGLGLGAVLMRQLAFMGIIEMTLKMIKAQGGIFGWVAPSAAFLAALPVAVAA